MGHGDPSRAHGGDFRPGAPGVGDGDFFRILRVWTTRRAGGHGTIPQFIRLAERISGQQLGDLFEVWLFTGSKPVLERRPPPRRRRPRGRGRRWGGPRRAERLRR